MSFQEFDCRSTAKCSWLVSFETGSDGMGENDAIYDMCCAHGKTANISNSSRGPITCANNAVVLTLHLATKNIVHTSVLCL